MATYRKLLKNRAGDTIIPVLSGDQSKWVQTGDLADGAVTPSKIDFTSIGEKQMSKYKFWYDWSGTIDGSTPGWKKIGKFQLNDRDHFGSKILSLKILRTYNYSQPEIYNIDLCFAWQSNTKLVQVSGTYAIHLITKVRTVLDSTNHILYLEIYTGSSTGHNDVLFSMEQFGTNIWGEEFSPMFTAQTEQESSLTVWGNELSTTN